MYILASCDGTIKFVDISSLWWYKSV